MIQKKFKQQKEDQAAQRNKFHEAMKQLQQLKKRMKEIEQRFKMDDNEEYKQEFKAINKQNTHLKQQLSHSQNLILLLKTENLKMKEQLKGRIRKNLKYM